MTQVHEVIRVRGSGKLQGSLAVSGSKNASLPILAASLLAQRSTFNNIPHLKDVGVLLELLSTFGMLVTFNDQGKLQLDASHLQSKEAPYVLLSKMRASFLVLGPLLARFGHARVALPGGCAIGSRPVDLHLKALEAMGAEIKLENGVVVASAPEGLRGVEFRFDMVSVGATENAMMAAVLAKGTSTLHHVAREPEVIALAEALIQSGVNIQGHGTETMVIEGRDTLEAIEYTIIPDRIEAGTFLIAAVMTQGDIKLTQVNPAHLEALLVILKQIGAKVTCGADWIHLTMDRRPSAFELVTEIYPGFSTDLQAQMMALACICEGTSIIKEGIFENRMMHVPELVRMGADIRLVGNVAIVTGRARLNGAEVVASDLRAAAALLLAGLVADGVTEIASVQHMDRGYVNVEERFRSLKADVQRIRHLC